MTFTKKLIKIVVFIVIFLFIFNGEDLLPNRRRFKTFKLSGKIVSEKGKPIPGADVVIPEKAISVKTNLDGDFLILCSPGGVVHLEVFKSGFIPASSGKFKCNSFLKMKKKKIVLYSSPLEEVVVTGTSTPKLYREAPVKTFVVNKNEIERKGALTLGDSLEIFTGVRVEDNCQNCNFTQVRICGMEGKYSQILIDGMPVISALAGVYVLDQIQSNMIEKLEVVKGGGSALYGGNAVAGVINIIKKESRESGVSLSLIKGSIFGKPETDIRLNSSYLSKNSETRLDIFSNYQKRDHIDYDGDGFSDLGELLDLSFGSDLSHYFHKLNGKLKITFNSIFEDRRGGNKFNLPEHMADIAESIRTYRADYGIGWEQTFSTKSILKLNSSYSYLKRKSYYGANQDINAYGLTKNPVFFGNMIYYDSSIKNHNFTTGFSFKSDSIDDSAPAYNRRINERYTDFGFFFQDEISFFKNNFILLLGVRRDKHSEIDTPIISPRISILFKGLKDFAFRGTFSTGFRAPQVFDEDLHITQVGGEGRLIINKNNLTEEKSKSYTLGFDFGKHVKNSLYQFSIGAFHNTICNTFTLKEISSLGNARVFERFNSGAATVSGIEIEAGYKLAGKFEVFAGWTFQNSILEKPEPQFGSKELFKSPKVYGNIRITFNLFGFIDLNSDFNYTGSMKIPHFAGYILNDTLETTKPFFVSNLNLSKGISVGRKNKIVISGYILNLFDEFQSDLDKGVNRDAGYIYGPRRPRTFRLGFKYSF